MEAGIDSNPVSIIHGNDLISSIYGTKILSIGCGTGVMEYRIKKQMPDTRIIGTDFAGTQVQKELWSKYGLEALVADGTHQPFPDESFDTCFTSNVLEHVPDPRGVIEESIRLTKHVAIHLIPINLNMPDHIHFFKFGDIDNEYKTQDADIDLKVVADDVTACLKPRLPRIEYELQISCPRDGSSDYGDMKFPVTRPDRPDGLMPCFLIKFYKYGKCADSALTGNTMKKILIVTYLERHLRKMLPIIKELEKHSDIELKVMLLTPDEWKLAESQGIKYSKFDDYATKERRADFDLEWGLEPLVNAIDMEKPDLFVAIEVNYILRNAVRHCKSMGIKTLIVQHGTPNKYSLHCFAPFEADCFAAWGDFTREFLVGNGVAPERIVVTGGPVFDKTVSLKPDKSQIYAELGIGPEIKKTIVFTTQGQGAGFRPSIEEIESGIIETVKAASQYRDVLLLFQAHPGQNVEDIQKVADKADHSSARVIKYHDTESLMAVSDGVITFFSTTAIDALILRKPLLLINLTDDREFFPFVPMGAAFGAYTKKEIMPAFRKLIESPEELKDGREKAIPYMVYKTDGKSLERVLNLIEKSLKE